MREHAEGNSRKIPRLQDKLRAEDQQEKFMEAEGLGPEHSKWIIECGQICKILKFWCAIVYVLYMYSYVLEHQGWCYSKGEGNVTPQFWPRLHDVYIVINHGEDLKEKSPPSIWLCMFRQ